MRIVRLELGIVCRFLCRFWCYWLGGGGDRRFIGHGGVSISGATSPQSILSGLLVPLAFLARYWSWKSSFLARL